MHGEYMKYSPIFMQFLYLKGEFIMAFKLD